MAVTPGLREAEAGPPHVGAHLGDFTIFNIKVEETNNKK